VKARPFGPQKAPVPVIGEGTWNMEGDDRAAAIAAIRRGLDLGVTHVDTAEMYGRGAVETIVGEAIAGRRDEVFLVSKVLPSNATRRGTVEACERSLRRLKTDRLDCYLLHWPGSHPLGDTIAAFEELVAAGKIRSWGVSNFDVEDLEKARAIAGDGKIACNQVLYHLDERAIELTVVPWCERHGVSVVAYSPFGSGSFPGPKSKGGKVLAEIAKERGASPYAVALAFLARRASVFAIPKSSDAAHVESNARAGAFELAPTEIARVDAAFPVGRTRPLPTL
jgi:diketogulonate reductase-like aldo/keto reductase